MIEAALSGSVLILIILALRAAFRKRIPQRVQYALWGLVLLRLCLPFPLFESRLSVLEAVPDVGVMQREIYVLPIDRYQIAIDETPDGTAEADDRLADANSFGYSVLSEDNRTLTRYADKMSLGELLSVVWRTGAVLMGVWFLLVNVRFAVRLRRTRQPFQASGCPLRVYISGELRSPCLFGLLRPAVYLTPQAAASPEALRCVLAHELAHYRHGDHIWAMARVFCTALYWWNPLVWAAAFASRRDSELACDEAVIRAMDAEQRLAYGRVLVDLIPVQSRPGGIARGATCMTSSRRSMKERVLMIARGSKTVLPALAVVVIAAIIAIGCTFSGAAAAQGDEWVNTLTHLQNGKPQSAITALTGEDAALAARIVENARSVSAAWEGPEPETLSDCWRITVAQPDGTVQLHYAYQVSGNSALADGSAVLQSDGWYSRISDELYAQLTALTESDPEHENLDLAVRDAILSNHMSAYTPGTEMVNAESHVILRQHIEGDFVTVYAVVRTMWAGYDQGVIAELTGSHMPVVITLEKGSLEHALAGGYSLVEYWVPEDGSRYESSIHEKFPEDLAGLALDLQAFAEIQSQECWRQVAEEGGLNALNAHFNGLLDSIMSGPAEASSTAAYIEAHRDEYDEFLSYGDEALRFICREFGNRLNARGLRGAVMQCAMTDLLGSEAIPFDASDGLDYYEKFRDHAHDLLDSTSEAYVAEHYPKTYLFLQMTTALGLSEQ